MLFIFIGGVSFVGCQVRMPFHVIIIEQQNIPGAVLAVLDTGPRSEPAVLVMLPLVCSADEMAAVFVALCTLAINPSIRGLCRHLSSVRKEGFSVLE